MKVMTTKMQQKFDKYWRDNNLVMTFSVVLDPRKKMRMIIEVAFPDFYSEDTYHGQVKLVHDKLYELFQEYVEEYKVGDVDNPSEMVAKTVATTSSESGEDKKLTGQDMFGSIIRNVTSSTSTYVKFELDFYLEVLEERTRDFNVID
ncbi:Zinc finger BED domain-containing protein DAYSLEEPER [Linum perenne]